MLPASIVSLDPLPSFPQPKSLHERDGQSLRLSSAMTAGSRGQAQYGDISHRIERGTSRQRMLSAGNVATSEPMSVSPPPPTKHSGLKSVSENRRIIQAVSNYNLRCV